jgi:hypothetical protein
MEVLKPFYSLTKGLRFPSDTTLRALAGYPVQTFHCMIRKRSSFREMRNAYKISVGKPLSNVTLGKTCCRWEGNIKIDLTERNRHSPVSVVTRLGTGQSGVRFPAGARIFTLRHRVQTGPGAHNASYPVGIGSKRPERKANHTPPSSAGLRILGAIPPLRHTSSWRGT